MRPNELVSQSSVASHLDSQQIATGTAVEVVPSSRKLVELVVARPARHSIRALPVEEVVIPCASLRGVVSVGAREAVVARAAHQEVVAITAAGPVLAGAPEDFVGTGLACYLEISRVRSGIDNVVAISSAQPKKLDGDNEYVSSEMPTSPATLATTRSFPSPPSTRSDAVSIKISS